MTVHTFTMTDSSVVDLLSVDVNPDAPAPSTPRQGGYTLRNRFNASTLARGSYDVTTAAGGIAVVKSTTAGTWTHNPLAVLEVPARTMVRDISLFAVHGQTNPGHQYYYSGSASAAGNTASNIKSTTLTFYGAPWKKSTGSSVATHVDGFGNINLSAVGASASGGTFTGSVMSASFSSSSGVSTISTPTQAGVVFEKTMTNMANAATSFRYHMYFPHGGRVIMKLEGGVTALNDSATGPTAELAKYSSKILGTWEVQAQCNYLPV